MRVVDIASGIGAPLITGLSRDPKSDALFITEIFTGRVMKVMH